MSESQHRRIRFQTKRGREKLSREDVTYWGDLLPKILKIGTEFEMLLPSPEAMLTSSADSPCIHADSGCSSDCANLETCLTDRHPVLCATRDTGRFLGEEFKCPAKSEEDVNACKNCPSWLLLCRGEACAMHTPFCTVCPSFQRSGDTIESADIRKDAEFVRKEMRTLLQPTEFVGRVGRTGVLEVKKDGSLPNGGIEIPTVGRRIHWQSFYGMCRDILEPLVERGGFVNERCGQHYHLLAGYLDRNSGGKAVSELEVSMPEIVLANLHQLHRRYELAMFWIMSAGADRRSLTRWARFRQSIQRFSALRSRMDRIQKEMGEAIIGMNSASAHRGKYASVAYHFCRFDEEGDVSTFHIENRIPDGVLSPAVATAWAMLIYSFVLKAVRLSQYGIMETGSPEELQQVKLIQPHLIDGGNREWGENRHANTFELQPHIPWLRASATEMVNWMKPELTGLGPAYDILSSLADRPCSIRLAEGQDWEQIENDLYGPYMMDPSAPADAVRDDFMELVDLTTITECGHLEVWVEEVAGYMGRDTQEIAQIVEEMLEKGEVRWSDPVGSLITAV